MKKLIIAALSLFTIVNLYAQSAEQKGLEVAKAAEQADEGFGSSTVKLKMTLIIRMKCLRV